MQYGRSFLHPRINAVGRVASARPRINAVGRVASARRLPHPQILH